jgi:hypothetical protein
MERLGIVDRGRDARVAQRRRDLVAVVDQDAVVGELRALGARRQHDAAAQGRVVARGHGGAAARLVLEDLELGEQHRRLDRVEPAVDADAHDVVGVAAHAVETDRFVECGARAVVGEDGAAVAVAAERLAWIEAGCRDRRERADHAIALARAEALRRVLDQQHVVALADRADRGIVGGEAEQVDREHGARPQLALLLDLAHRRLERRGVEVVGRVLDVDEHRCRAQRHRHLGRGAVGEARQEDGVARPDIVGHQRDAQGIGAARHADSVRSTGQPREGGFELRDLGAEDVAAGGQHLGDAGIDRLLDAAILGLQVDERDGREGLGRVIGHGGRTREVCLREGPHLSARSAPLPAA